MLVLKISWAVLARIRGGDRSRSADYPLSRVAPAVKRAVKM